MKLTSTQRARLRVAAEKHLKDLVQFPDSCFNARWLTAYCCGMNRVLAEIGEYDLGNDILAVCDRGDKIAR